MNETIMHKEIFLIPESLTLTKSYNEKIVKELKKVFLEKILKM